jgi:HlyD family secretion protein
MSAASNAVNASAVADTGVKVEQASVGPGWLHPLAALEHEDPAHVSRVVLWSVCLLLAVLLVWACVGKLDIVASAQGRLVPQTLLKIVQPAEPGVVRDLLVDEGDQVAAGQTLVRLDTTLARADRAGVDGELTRQRMQLRRVRAELAQRPMTRRSTDDAELFGNVQQQYAARYSAHLDSLGHERSLLRRAEHEHDSAVRQQRKLEETLPVYEESARAFDALQREGFASVLAASERQRDASEKRGELGAQRAMVSALEAAVQAQSRRLAHSQSNYRRELEDEQATIHARIAQLQPDLEKSTYREGLMELRAPDAGVVKDLATTTVGAVVQPGDVLLTMVPADEPLYADVHVLNEDVGLVSEGQQVQVKLAAFPFQRYGMMRGTVQHLGADASQQKGDETGLPPYKARIRLDRQTLTVTGGKRHALIAGMQVTAEIHLGRRTVLQYLLSPIQKTLHEYGRER